MSLINGLLALLGEIESDAIAVHEERCISVRNRNADCLRCVEACTSGALAYRAGELLVEPERCIGCGTCATACPTCAIELRSFSKNAGFTGVRLGFTVVPKDLVRDGVDLHSLWARRHGTKFNGAPYIVQRAGEAVYSPEGKAQLKEQVGYYMSNAKAIYEGLASAGYSVSGGVNAPYIWLKTPDKMTSWEFFDYLLEKANIVGTPGSGFGAHGEGFFRLTAFGTHENTLEAIERIKNL